MSQTSGCNDIYASFSADSPVESVGSVESGKEVAQPKDLDIMTQVLGLRSRYHKGYGSMPRLKTVGGNRAASSRGTYQDHEKDQVIATLEERLAAQAEQLAAQAAQLATQAVQLAAQNDRLNETTNVLAQMQKFILGFQYHPSATTSSATPNNPSSD
ncbi:hypothetical protein LguiB_005604 [Lonicera macranthoides]